MTTSLLYLSVSLGQPYMLQEQMKYGLISHSLQVRIEDKLPTLNKIIAEKNEKWVNLKYFSLV